MNSDNTKYTLLYDTLRDLNKRIRRLLHQSLSDLIDPSRSYTSTMLLNAVMGYGNTPNLTAVGKKSKALMSSEAKLNNKGRFYRTSPSILALFGDSGSSEARKFLQRNAPLYTPIPGVVTPFQVKLDKVKEWDMPAASMENLSRINSANIETSRPTSTMAMNGTSRPGSSLRMTGTGSRPGTQQSLHSTQDGISPLKERKSKKKLDFHRLFEAQPDAHFYPPEMYGEDTLRPDDHDISFHPGSEVSTDLRINDIVEVADAVEKQIQEIKNRKVYTSNILPYTLPLDVPKHKSNSSANVGGFKVTTAFIEQGANVLLSNSHSKLTFGEEKRVLYNARDNAHPKKSNAQNGKKKSLGHGFQSQSNDRLVLSSTGQYVHESELNMQYAMHKHGDAHDDHSLSSATDNRSLVHNKASDVSPNHYFSLQYQALLNHFITFCRFPFH